MIFWLNGEFKNAPGAIDVADRGFLLGDGVFETLLTVDGVPAFLDAHIARLRAALKTLCFDHEIDESIGAILHELARRNRLAEGRAAARITITRGAGVRGLLFPAGEKAPPTVLVTIQRYSPPPGAAPPKLMISRYVRAEAGVSARLKTTNYLDNILARNEAAAGGRDDAVMLNSAGRAACASAANIFLASGDGLIVTPPVSEGALPGVVRGLLLGGAQDAGAAIEERPIDRAALARSTVFITNSLIGVQLARFADAGDDPARAVGDKIVHRLCSWYEDALRADVRERAREL